MDIGFLVYPRHTPLDLVGPWEVLNRLPNAKMHLKKGGRLLLIVKARSIDGLKEPAQVFKEEAQLLREKGFAVEKVIDLRPYDKDHALISATMR